MKRRKQINSVVLTCVLRLSCSFKGIHKRFATNYYYIFVISVQLLLQFACILNCGYILHCLNCEFHVLFGNCSATLLQFPNRSI